jgi:hypothetical protein
MRTYEYLYEVKATGFLEIENIGEVCLVANNDFMQEQLLIIHTELGKTKIIQYGPVYVDNVQPPTNCIYTFTEIDFSDYKIDKTIEKFINDPKFRTTQVTQIEFEDAMDRITDLREFI